MSVGLCFTTCQGSYAFGVVNYQTCWCTDIAPDKSTQVDLSECNLNCPGWPDDKCGGSGNKFGYVALGMEPSGTSGASTPSPTPSTVKVSLSSLLVLSTLPVILPLVALGGMGSR